MSIVAIVTPVYEDEASFADLNDEPKKEEDAPVARSEARSSSSSAAAASKESGVPAEVASTRTVKIDVGASRARMTVEAIDDDEWPDE